MKIPGDPILRPLHPYISSFKTRKVYFCYEITSQFLINWPLKIKAYTNVFLSTAQDMLVSVYINNKEVCFNSFCLDKNMRLYVKNNN